MFFSEVSDPRNGAEWTAVFWKLRLRHLPRPEWHASRGIRWFSMQWRLRAGGRGWAMGTWAVLDGAWPGLSVCLCLSGRMDGWIMDMPDEDEVHRLVHRLVLATSGFPVLVPHAS